MANSGLVIVSLLMIVCDRSNAINQRNARILRRETLPDGTIQVTVPREDAVMINGVLSAVVPTYQCVRTVQNGLYRQQLTYPCKPRVIIANQSAGLIATTRAPVRTRSVPDISSTISLEPRVTTRAQSNADGVVDAATQPSSNDTKLTRKVRKQEDVNSSQTDDADDGTLLTNSFRTNNSTKPRGCRFSCRYSTTPPSMTSMLPTIIVSIAPQATTAANASTTIRAQSNTTTTTLRPAPELGPALPSFSGSLAAGANSTNSTVIGKGVESATPRSNSTVSQTVALSLGTESVPLALPRANSSLPKNCSRVTTPTAV